LKAHKKRKHKPMFMEPLRPGNTEVEQSEHLPLYCDDLQNTINQNMDSRRQAAEQAGKRHASDHFVACYAHKARNQLFRITGLRPNSHMKPQKALAMLKNGISPKKPLTAWLTA
jgi:glutamyl-tRNA reductase